MPNPIAFLKLTSSCHLAPIYDYLLIGCYGILSTNGNIDFSSVLDFYMYNKTPSSHSISILYNTITEHCAGGNFNYIHKLNPMNYSNDNFKSIYNILKHYELRYITQPTLDVLYSRGYSPECKIYRLYFGESLFLYDSDFTNFRNGCNKYLCSGLEKHPVYLDYLNNGFLRIHPITHNIPGPFSGNHFKLLTTIGGVHTYISTYGIEIPIEMVKYFIPYGKEISSDYGNLYNALHLITDEAGSQITNSMKRGSMDLKSLYHVVKSNKTIVDTVLSTLYENSNFSFSNANLINEPKILLSKALEYKDISISMENIPVSETISDDTLKYYDSLNCKFKSDSFEIKKEKCDLWLKQIK